MNSYQVTAYKDGKWWTFEIPALSSPSPRGKGHRIIAMGQAKAASEIEDEAKALAALWTEKDEASISVEVTYRLPVEVEEAINSARQLDDTGRAALDQAATLRRQAVHQLRTAVGLSQADSALVLGLSRQRVQQLEAAK